MTYSEKLKDQRWQKKRLELLEAAGWQCQCNSCQNEKDKPTLHVHHRIYLRNTDPWEYEDWAYQVLCDECHGFEQDIMESAHSAIAKHADLMVFCNRINNIEDRELQREISENLNMLFGTWDGNMLWEISKVLRVIEEVSLESFRVGARMIEQRHAETSQPK